MDGTRCPSGYACAGDGFCHHPDETAACAPDGPPPDVTPPDASSPTATPTVAVPARVDLPGPRDAGRASAVIVAAPRDAGCGTLAA